MLHAIFGEKAREVRDTSLRVPHGAGGIVLDVKVFNREEGDDTLSPGVNQLSTLYIVQKRKIHVGDKMCGRHGNKGLFLRLFLKKICLTYQMDVRSISCYSLGVPSRMNIGQVLELHLGMAAKSWYFTLHHQYLTVQTMTMYGQQLKKLDGS
ncbi:hypothetical protein ACVXZ0_04340 [Staphylococcus aureus]